MGHANDKTNGLAVWPAALRETPSWEWHRGTTVARVGPRRPCAIPKRRAGDYPGQLTRADNFRPTRDTNRGNRVSKAKLILALQATSLSQDLK